jgi:hypothetical protein
LASNKRGNQSSSELTIAIAGFDEPEAATGTPKARVNEALNNNDDT